MITKQEPSYGAKVRNDSIVVGHYLDYAIIKTEDGHLCCTEDEDGILQDGELYLGEVQNSIERFSLPEQLALEEIYGKEVV